MWCKYELHSAMWCKYELHRNREKTCFLLFNIKKPTCHSRFVFCCTSPAKVIYCCCYINYKESLPQGTANFKWS